MARPVVKLKPGAVPALEKSKAMQQILAEEAKKRMQSIPDVTVEPPFVGRTRARQIVRSHSPAASEALRRALRR